MVDGEFQMAQSYSVTPFEKAETIHTKYADIYQVEINVELVLHVGMMPGCKVRMFNTQGPGF